MIEFTEAEKKILNEIQKDLGIVERPFQKLGETVGLSEEEAIATVKKLKADKVIRQISAIFDTRSLGYESSLVAAKVKKEKLQQAADVMNTHPGVSHNYARNHAYNLWYTVAVPPNSRLGLAKTVELFHQLSGAEQTRLMPTLKLYKIGVAFDVAGENKPESKTGPAPYKEEDRTPDDKLNQKEMDFVRELQEDLPIVASPFAPIAKKLGLSLKEMVAMGQNLQKRGKLRRISAVLHHRRAGFTANAMGVWVVPESRFDELGPVMGNYRAVSHCYRRPTYPDWPYTIFTMVHGKSAADCETVLKTISKDTGIADYLALYSIKEFKKTRVRYFTPETYAWETQYAPLFKEPATTRK